MSWRRPTAPYDREMVVDEFGPLTGAARERWLRARRKRGRPRRGKGAKVISVTVEKGLLARSDSLARDLGPSRAGLIKRGLEDRGLGDVFAPGELGANP